jgi:hypothetical protein
MTVICRRSGLPGEPDGGDLGASSRAPQPQQNRAKAGFPAPHWMQIAAIDAPQRSHALIPSRLMAAHPGQTTIALAMVNARDSTSNRRRYPDWPLTRAWTYRGRDAIWSS